MVYDREVSSDFYAAIKTLEELSERIVLHVTWIQKKTAKVAHYVKVTRRGGYVVWIIVNIEAFIQAIFDSFSFWKTSLEISNLFHFFSFGTNDVHLIKPVETEQ